MTALHPFPHVHLELLNTFVTVVHRGGFTEAARHLNKTQPTISAQIKKLETELGHPLLSRDTRNFELTPAGEITLELAQQMLRLSRELLQRLDAPDVHGTIRLGTPEDFATAHLSSVLADFREDYPRVRLEVTCDLTRNLQHQLDDGLHDIVLLKQEPRGGGGRGSGKGTRVWLESLVWVGHPNHPIDTSDEISLVVSPEPCVYRARALAALRKQRRKFHVGYQSTSLTGSLAAVQAGLGVTILPRDMVDDGFRVLGERYGFPPLPATEIALVRAPHATSAPVAALFDYMVDALERASVAHS
ncbi:MAG: LysR family transcriptional regulator [Pseudomonadota bacterium]